jgi:hypothetical protein
MVIVPCTGPEVTATDVALPVIDSGSVLLLLLAATLALMLATVGADTGPVQVIVTGVMWVPLTIFNRSPLEVSCDEVTVTVCGAVFFELL